ncbi:MAG: hypothetical protein JSV74_03275 [Dehalococcoidia bacterium]|nr:MAG: hypothetical protein JSV74_03275 [Dehalococcoidia bacterium]
MKEEELKEKLERVDIPHIMLESHRSRLKMALLSSDYFKKRKGNRILDAVRIRARSITDTMVDTLVARQPVWKVALVVFFAMIMIGGMVFGLGSLNGTQQAGLNPAGYTIIGGDKLTEAEEELAMDILKADPRIQSLLAGGATIDIVLPILVEFGKINPETGQTETVQETWAQAWIAGIDGKTWGAVVDLVKGEVTQLSE